MDFYFDKLAGLNNDELMTEIQNLHTKLTKMNPQSPMTLQIQEMIRNAQTEYNERLIVDRLKDKPTEEVLEIGEIETVVVTPDYSEEEVQIALAQHFSGDKISRRKKEMAERDEKIKKQIEHEKSLRPKKLDEKAKEIINQVDKP